MAAGAPSATGAHSGGSNASGMLKGAKEAARRSTGSRTARGFGLAVRSTLAGFSTLANSSASGRTDGRVSGLDGAGRAGRAACSMGLPDHHATVARIATSSVARPGRATRSPRVRPGRRATALSWISCSMRARRSLGPCSSNRAPSEACRASSSIVRRFRDSVIEPRSRARPASASGAASLPSPATSGCLPTRSGRQPFPRTSTHPSQRAAADRAA